MLPLRSFVLESQPKKLIQRMIDSTRESLPKKLLVQFRSWSFWVEARRPGKCDEMTVREAQHFVTASGIWICEDVFNIAETLRREEVLQLENFDLNNFLNFWISPFSPPVSRAVIVSEGWFELWQKQWAETEPRVLSVDSFFRPSLVRIWKEIRRIDSLRVQNHE